MKHKFFMWMCILLGAIVNAQNPADIDPTFQIGKSFSKLGTINAIAAQSNGKIIAAGSFNSYDQISANYIVRLNADGTIDTAFNTGNGFNGNVISIAVQSHDKILVGGEYTSFNGITANYIVRLNADGTLDKSFNTGTGFNYSVSAIALQQDGKILLGGFFTSYNAIQTNGFIRLNIDGTIDNAFNLGTVFGGIGNIVVQSDGKILVEKSRLNSDGSFDSSFIPDPGVGYLNVISLQSNGKIIIGGYGFLFRLNSDGTKDLTFNPGIGFNYTPSSIKIQSDGKILISGGFDYNGASANAIRMNSDGTVDHVFNFEPEEVGVQSINSILILTDGKILFGGSMTLYNKNSISGLVKVDSNGLKDDSFNLKNAAYELYSTSSNRIIEQADGKIIVAGDFSYYFGTLSSGIVRLNKDGTKDKSFDTGTGLNNGSVTSIALQKDGKILVGGAFSLFNGLAAKNIIRLNADGTIDNTFNTGTGVNGQVYAICLQPDGKILVGGQFGGLIIRLNPDGSLDNSFNALVYSSYVNTIAVQTDGKILVGSIGGTGFLRLNQDGTTDNTFNIGTGFSITNMGHATTRIFSTVIQADGKILIAGAFNNYDGTTVNGFVRLNSDASIDTAFIPETNASIGTINCIGVQSNGKILIGMTNYINKEGNDITRLNPDGKIDTSFNGHLFDRLYPSGISNVYDGVYGLMIQKDGKIIAGGVFDKYDGKTCMGIVRLSGDSFLSTENFTKVKMSLYPNPAYDIINIQVPNDLKIDKIIITDMTGRTILKLFQSKAINIENLASGIYIIKVFSGQSNWQSKFTKE